MESDLGWHLVKPEVGGIYENMAVSNMTSYSVWSAYNMIEEELAILRACFHMETEGPPEGAVACVATPSTNASDVILQEENSLGSLGKAQDAKKTAPACFLDAHFL